MEPVSKRSKISPPEDAYAISIAKTSMSFSGRQAVYVRPTTAETPTQRQFLFEILPNSR